MARMALTFGACPVCGDHVPRTVQLAAGLEKEIFHCNTHGRMAYERHGIPLAQLHAASTPAGHMLEAPPMSLSSPMAGIELVC